MVPKLLKLLRNARKNQKEIIKTHENVTDTLQKEHKKEKMELLDVHAKETEQWQSQLNDTQKRQHDERLDQTNVLWKTRFTGWNGSKKNTKKKRSTGTYN